MYSKKKEVLRSLAKNDILSVVFYHPPLDTHSVNSLYAVITSQTMFNLLYLLKIIKPKLLIIINSNRN